MNVLIADGGTGGHIFPAIAIADELKRRKEVENVLFTGTPFGLETEIVPRHGYDLRLIHVGGLIGKGIGTRMKTMAQLPMAYFESSRILRDFHPSVVIGFGAYASGPVIVASWMKRIPVMLVESNAVPGFTNRISARFAKKVAVPFEDRADVFRGKAVVTGVPSRPLQKKTVQKDRFTLGIFCGSQGSIAINDTLIQALPRFAEIRERIQIVHQTGKRDFERVKAEYEKRAPFFEVIPFVTDVEEFYSKCDLLICRAGAITLAELTSLGKPSILVPLPTATHNHQEQNARRLAEAGAARLILQKDFTPDVLWNEVHSVLQSPEKLQPMQEAARKLGRPDATKQVVDLALGLVK